MKIKNVIDTVPERILIFLQFGAAIILFLISILFISCNPPTNPEIIKINPEIQNTDKEEDERKQSVINAAMNVFETKDKESLDWIFTASGDGVIFRDDKSRICLGYLFNNKKKKWESTGLFKNVELILDVTPDTYGEFITLNDFVRISRTICLNKEAAKKVRQETSVNKAKYSSLLKMIGAVPTEIYEKASLSDMLLKNNPSDFEKDSSPSPY